MGEEHRPDPQFLSRLEWQLSTELRRQERFSQRNGGQSWTRRIPWKGIGLVGLSILVGWAGAIAAGHLQGDSWRKDLWMARSTIALELAQIRLEFTQEGVEEEKESTLENYFIALGELLGDKHKVRMAKLDLEEVQASGDRPQSELVAPLVYGRDFVSERIQCEMQRIQEEIDRDHRYVEAVERERGEVDPFSHLDEALQQRNEEIDKNRRLLTLRSAFLEGKMSPSEVEARSQLREAEERRNNLESQLQLATRQLIQVREALEEGRGSEINLKIAEFELKTIAAKARLAQSEVDLLHRRVPGYSASGSVAVPR